MKFNNRNVFISPNAIIGNNVKIGDNSTIYDNVSIGDNAIIANHRRTDQRLLLQPQLYQSDNYNRRQCAH